mmetsp:Transcript_44144/g.172125  ORF Transcript_44144/g.172125 Transcript_44144/m.172125 type:complete len:256 (-) Transcript_44144:1238-2005(-)
MYHDLNVELELFKDKKTRCELLETVSKFGYETIAVNETIDGRVSSELEPSIAGSLRSEDCIRDDKGLRLRGIRILSRVTVNLGNAQRVDFLRAAEAALRKFDVVAVCPTSERQLKLCMELDFINIVAFESSARTPFNIKPQLIASLEARGILVEVVYAPAIRDASLRRLVVVNGSSISRITNSKTLLISSGARHVLVSSQLKYSKSCSAPGKCLICASSRRSCVRPGMLSTSSMFCSRSPRRGPRAPSTPHLRKS